MIRPGRLRHRVALHQMTETTNDLGEVERSYAYWRSVWCSIETFQSFEAIQQQRLESAVIYKVRMRHVDGLQPTMRIHWKTHILEITSMVDKFDESVHDLTCAMVIT